MTRKPRQKDDFYSTPLAVIDSILPHLPLGRDILEPAAGDGAILQRLRARGVQRERLTAIELDRDRSLECDRYARTLRGDALDMSWATASLVITNPPFKLAQRFVEKALACVEETGGTVAMLLRLTFLESRERIALHNNYPADVYILPSRPKFVHGKTDMVTSAWFVWGPSRGGHWGILDVRGDK
jgi:hypothetical protein